MVAGEEVFLFMGLLAALQILLHRYTGQTDIVVGAPVACRKRAKRLPGRRQCWPKQFLPKGLWSSMLMTTSRTGSQHVAKRGWCEQDSIREMSGHITLMKM